jgi:glycosyltransferase involved in cell wall biosynthesis
LHREVGFDLVHQATYCGYREPGYAWKLPIPFVWGGIGGTHNFPAAFLSQAGIGSAISESLRTLANHAQMRWSSHVRSAASASALVLAGNSQMQRHLRDLYGVEAPLFPASGIESVAQKSRRFRDEDGPTRLLWCGNFHALKGLPLVLQAIARLADPSRVRLRIVGSGPMEKSWKALANRLGIEKSIEWTGRIPHHEALKQYNWAEAFVCTSLRETLPGVVLESLAAGVPVITLDHLGMGDAVTPECGFKIPVTDPEQVASDIADAINEVARQPDRWEAMSAAALARANQYTWSSQEKRLAQHYMRVLGDETWQVPADKSRRSVALAQAPAA